MTHTPTKPSAAERAHTFIRRLKENEPGDIVMPSTQKELTALIEKADACDAWRAEAIAAQEALGDQPEGCWEKLAEARAARLAKGLT